VAELSPSDSGIAPASDHAAGRLLLVDGHAYAYRAFHAIRSLNAPGGEPTNAIFGFIKMFNKARAQVRPDRVGVIWDGGLAAQRLDLLPAYKAQRPPMPEALERQLDEIVAWLRASGIFSFCGDGVEADDCIAALARRAEAERWRVVIASSDKDFMQLVSDAIGLMNPNDKTETIWGMAEVRARTGVEPRQIVDWLSLIGDAADNIAGVPGVGPKTAADLLQRFGSVDALYERLAEVASERLRSLLAAHEVAVRRNRELIRLHETLPPGCDLPQLQPQPANPDALRELYQRWGFRTLLRELEEQSSPQAQLL
jgi:DNA polymerase-1